MIRARAPSSFDDFIGRLQKVARIDFHEADEALPLADLGVDSLRVFELMVLAEALAGCDVPPIEAPVLETLEDLHLYYLRCLDDG